MLRSSAARAAASEQEETKAGGTRSDLLNDAFLTNKSKVPPRQVGKRHGRAVGWLPLPIFILTSLAFTFLWPILPLLPCALAVLAVAWACFMHGFYTSNLSHEAAGGGNLRSQAANLVLLTSALATGIGAVAGLYAAETHMSVFYSLAFGQAYRDVPPYSPGATYADAGEILFANTAFLDSDSSLGYRDHTTYCVAPVLDMSTDVKEVTFWAVGLDCCAARGDFQCGDANGNATKGGGGVRLERHDGFLGHYGLFGRPRDTEFREAVKQAAAVYSLSLGEEIILVSWSSSPSYEKWARFGKAIGTIAFGACLFLLVVLTMAVIYNYYGGKPRASRSQSVPDTPLPT